MTDEQQTLLLIRGTIASLPETDRAAVEKAAQALREVMKDHGGHGAVAIALVGAEISAKL